MRMDKLENSADNKRIIRRDGCGGAGKLFFRRNDMKKDFIDKLKHRGKNLCA